MLDEMTKGECDQIVALLEALEADWAVVDEEEDWDYVLLVNESRMEMEDFKPSKSLIQKAEDLGLIVDSEATFGSRPRETGFHYESSAPEWEVRTVSTLLPIVYFYKVTEKGREFLG